NFIPGRRRCRSAIPNSPRTRAELPRILYGRRSGARGPVRAAWLDETRNRAVLWITGIARSHAIENRLYGRKCRRSGVLSTRLSKARTRAEHGEVLYLVKPRPRLIVVLFCKCLQHLLKRDAERDDSETECGRVDFARLHVLSPPLQRRRLRQASR